jgi:hypothetical protein
MNPNPFERENPPASGLAGFYVQRRIFSTRLDIPCRILAYRKAMSPLPWAWLRHIVIASL